MFNVAGGGRLGEHAVYPGTFDPLTPGHLDIIERARHLFARLTVLVAVNGDKQPAGTHSERAIQLRRRLPADWDNVSVAAWAGLTAAFCRQHGAGVIIRGVRNQSDLRHECQLAAMNEALDVTTLLLPATPRLAAVSSTLLRGLGGQRLGGQKPPNRDRVLRKRPHAARSGALTSAGAVTAAGGACPRWPGRLAAGR
jgi:pantetheine-phosphate adenylyltransferase